MIFLSLISMRCTGFQLNQLVRPAAPLMPAAGRLYKLATSTRSSQWCNSDRRESPLRLFSSFENKRQDSTALNEVPLYRSEGLFAVDKPIEWTSQDVVSYIRGILDREARSRGARTARVTDRRNKDRVIRVGHGGTLDPLATGVLVIGVGKGTKELQRYVFPLTPARTRKMCTHILWKSAYELGSH